MSHATGKIEPAHSKIVSLPALLITWVVLCALASLSALLGTVDLHGLSTLVSVVIASIMAVIAALYFMHLRYDHPFYIIMLVLTLIFITIFISFRPQRFRARNLELLCHSSGRLGLGSLGCRCGGGIGLACLYHRRSLTLNELILIGGRIGEGKADKNGDKNER